MHICIYIIYAYIFKVLDLLMRVKDVLFIQVTSKVCHSNEVQTVDPLHYSKILH